ncbi:hypothetical protein GCK72_010410 [Caenorhabditis remanei]|uniref:Uncharacterized protein n=1 Tax=Caenorhabditis remanei TaxID=31234 RepID=A0A6A5H373_CAERE|nr:hypothetical protein GCK72_010410 [Caenorhabditis remanei]KAF1762148.1 hypothetical protein GCK72_010410 [Caenorhabditis remanei]
MISSLIIFNYSFSDKSPSWIPQSGALIQNVEEINDYDAACSGYSVGRILREQKRVLASVRSELVESQNKIEEIRAVQEELQRLIPQKQLELSALEGEIEAAQRQLEELRETQNVKVFLPYSPLVHPKVSQELPQVPHSILNFDDVIDYSRCSISSFMPIFVDRITDGRYEKEWENVFRKAASVLTEKSDEACLKIRITNGILDTDDSYNTVLFNTGNPLKVLQNLKLIMVQSSQLRSFDLAVLANYTSPIQQSPVPLLPIKRKYLIGMVVRENSRNLDLSTLEDSGKNTSHKFIIRKCYENKNSIEFGCIPIILSISARLPFEDLIDWRRAAHRLPIARLPEAHFIIRSFETSDILEMRRIGRTFFETYMADRKSIADSLIAALRFKLQIPTLETRSNQKNQAVPLFNSSFTSPRGSLVNVQPNFDDEYLLGPLESRVESVSFAYNFTEFQLYSYEIWNTVYSPFRSKEFIINAAEPPAEAEFHEDTKIGFRAIEPGSGVEFSKALGGNRQREQFTVILLTYERDSVLVGALERLHQLPYLNKILVVWNNIHREPPDTWPSLHVPVEFIRVTENSLNNRFVPWDRIETESVLSLDDDIDLMQQEIILAFRVWRENRDRIVGFPARYHARYGDSMFYNSNHTCQMSMILTGAAFIHKNYLSAYTYQMSTAIRDHVDKIKNCEDIAMNFLVAHLTRKPPIKTTSRWTLKYDVPDIYKSNFFPDVPPVQKACSRQTLTSKNVTSAYDCSPKFMGITH